MYPFSLSLHLLVETLQAMWKYPQVFLEVGFLGDLTSSQVDIYDYPSKVCLLQRLCLYSVRCPFNNMVLSFVLQKQFNFMWFYLSISQVVSYTTRGFFFFFLFFYVSPYLCPCFKVSNIYIPDNLPSVLSYFSSFSLFVTFILSV